MKCCVCPDGKGRVVVGSYTSKKTGAKIFACKKCLAKPLKFGFACFKLDGSEMKSSKKKK